MKPNFHFQTRDTRLPLSLERLSGWINPADAFVALFASEPNSFWLDRSSNPEEPFTVMGSGSRVLELEQNDLQSIRTRLAELNRETDGQKQDLPFAFRPGLVGYFSYELTEGARELGEPVGRWIVVDRAIVFDHRSRAVFFIGLFHSQTEFELWHRAALLRFTLIGGEAAALMTKSPLPRIVSITSRHGAKEYLGKISRAKEYIAAGEAYQICLTNQISLEVEANALPTFLALREQNPAPYGSYLQFGDLKIVSSSPEQFLRVGVSGTVSTKPIKGTRPRHPDPVADTALAEELRLDEKERAENLMIVDLMRNDLLRVCEADSVRVDELFEVRSYATVHQLVSTISGRLQIGKDAIDAIEACFPAGSMTGAPKMRAMQILRELEQGPRGIYSGAIGFLGIDGSADLAMTIRTLVFRGNQVALGVGGGLTIDSIPESELEETMLKADALIRALGGAKWKI